MTLERKVAVVHSRISGLKLDKPPTFFEKFWCSRYIVKKNDEVSRGMLTRYIKAVDFGCTQTFGKYKYDKLFSRVRLNQSEESEQWTYLTSFVIECIFILFLGNVLKGQFNNFAILGCTFLFILFSFLVGSRRAICIYPFIMVLVYFLMFYGII